MSNNTETKDKASQEDTVFENPLDQITDAQKKELLTIGEKSEHWHDRGALARAELRYALKEDGERKHANPKFDELIVKMLPVPWTKNLIHATNWRVPFAPLAKREAEVRGKFNRSKFNMSALLLHDADGKLLSSDGKSDLRDALKGALSLLFERVDAINNAGDVLTSEHLVLLRTALDDYLKGTRSKADKEKAAKREATEATKAAGGSGEEQTALEAIMGVAQAWMLEEQGDNRLTGEEARTIAQFLTDYAHGLEA